MKIMEVSVEQKNSTIEPVTPTRKKMKQAQLPFQMISPLSSSNAISNKKRKLESPSPVRSKSPGSTKKANNQNLAKKAKSSDIEVIDLENTKDEENAGEGESSKKIVYKHNDSETLKAEAAVTSDKRIKVENKEEVKKQKDYGVLSMFLKKAKSQERSDDVVLLTLSDYDSGNSKDSEPPLKNKMDSEIAKEQSTEVVSEKMVMNITQHSVVASVERDVNVILEKTAMDTPEEIVTNTFKEPPDESVEKSLEQSCEDFNGVQVMNEVNGTSTNDKMQKNRQSDQGLKQTNDEETKIQCFKLKSAYVDLTDQKRETMISDDNNAKNGDSDSDIGISSSDDDVNDDLDKSSNENGDKNRTLNESEGSKTPRNEKSTPSRNKKLTPKQIERRLLSAKKREEQRKMKMEREKKLEEERETRRKEKEERRKVKRQEKEMKEQKRQIEIELKQKEKEAKEDERRKKEEEKLEAERKKQKAAVNFANFFVPKKPDAKIVEEDVVVKDQLFMPFEVKADMRVAPITRRNLDDTDKLTFDKLLNKGISKDELYLNGLIKNPTNIRRSQKTWPYEAKDVVIIVDDDDGSSDTVDPRSASLSEKHHPKLFMFVENRRPPFWGTWRKKSDHITPRRPFAKDSKWFDYEIDSDDEWEEEEPGESIRGSDDERDEELAPEENEYDVDNDFMVPHGYLSDEEAKADEEDGEDLSPESQKLKLKLMNDQFEAERKTKTSKIKPRAIGCIWQGSRDNSYPENITPHVLQFFSARQAWVYNIPVILGAAPVVDNSIVADFGSPSMPVHGARKKHVPEEMIPNLIRLVHGNNNGRISLIREFQAFWEKNKTDDRQISKMSLSRKIKEIATWRACPDEGPMFLRSCWYVSEDVRREYNCLDITLPNQWKF
ncbi:chromatin assembly factor 1 subunit A [Athalia rosae]|uniref:chromatin assembly factor 1 subunit A n=1 Tax=Athalia rosae TaxID=37344 RepID=UPI0020345C0C|nr:chromatin assembly factor 1 subunit A [Athalia rosae]XP_048508583.1 chromatin assembly factor 1 subunit A [Athalia rosae]